LVIRLAVYYAALAALAWLVARTIPQWGVLFGERTPGGAAVAMLGALALMCPVAWMYMRTKPKLRYDPSLVQTVIVLPVVISGVVLIVRDSVALAFSLAGIVAAVRFRNTLRDTKDAVYIFLAIAVGLAAGVGSFAIGLVVSVIYVASYSSSGGSTSGPPRHPSACRAGWWPRPRSRPPPTRRSPVCWSNTPSVGS